ncbi:hypothetical protein [Mucisphaera sp.]|uniref:hypothetical protein n=1 Tax=Mucisphaera sp. TaxID=2913024 RepID=UPI003D11BE04
MSHHGPLELQESDKRRISEGLRGYTPGLLIAGLIVVAIAYVAALFTDDRSWERFVHAYLLNASFYLTLSLGGLFFVLGTHLFRAAWCASVRRIPEVLAANLGVVALLFVPVLVIIWSNTGALYPWAQPFEQMPGYHAAAPSPETESGYALADVEGFEIQMIADEPHADGEHHGDEAGHAHGAEINPAVDGAGRQMTYWMVSSKQPWLSSGFFTIRVIFYFVIWIAMAWWYFGLGQRQDASGEASLSATRETYAPPLVFVYALTVAFGAMDIVMSLDPAFYSTMLPVIVFTGGFLSALCLTVLIALYLQGKGYLGSVNVEHYHDLGKLMFAFVFFWGYTSFSQFMLLWYASIPETVYWLENRGLSISERFINEPTGWWWISAVLLFGHLLIPFAYLVTRKTKRNLSWLAVAAVWLLIMHWFDMYWMIMPEFSTPTVPGFTVEVLLLIGLGLIYAAGVARLAAGRHAMAIHDPRMPECLALKQL